MTIIYLHQYFNTPEMSGGTRSYEMARRFVANGHKVHMITSWRGVDKGDDWFETSEKGIIVHWIPVPYSNHMGYYKRIKSFFLYAYKAAKRTLDLDGDIIFATSTPLTIAFPAVYASRRLKIPLVFEVRDLWPEIPVAIGAIRNPLLKWLSRRLEKFAYNNSEAVVALSAGMRNGIVKTGYMYDRVAIIPNSSDNKFFNTDKNYSKLFREQRYWLNDRPLLLYAGTFGKINGLGYLVKLAKYLKIISPEIRILAVGDGIERDMIFKEASSAKVLNDNFFIENSVSKSQMPLLFSAADISISLTIDLPVLHANSANKFFDSLASGTPIFLNYGGWQADLVNSYECGVVGWRKPISEVAEIISDKIQDRNWLKNAGENARRLAEDKFDRDELASQLEEVLIAASNKDGQKARSIAAGDF